MCALGKCSSSALSRRRRTSARGAIQRLNIVCACVSVQGKDQTHVHTLNFMNLHFFLFCCSPAFAIIGCLPHIIEIEIKCLTLLAFIGCFLYIRGIQ